MLLVAVIFMFCVSHWFCVVSAYTKEQGGRRLERLYGFLIFAKTGGLLSIVLVQLIIFCLSLLISDISIVGIVGILLEV